MTVLVDAHHITCSAVFASCNYPKGFTVIRSYYVIWIYSVGEKRRSSDELKQFSHVLL